MHRRAFLKTTMGVSGGIVGGRQLVDQTDATTPTDSDSGTERQTEQGMCTGYDEDGDQYDYNCYNPDADADFDTFYVNASAGDESRVYEMNPSTKLDVTWDYYWDYAGYGYTYGIRGTVSHQYENPKNLRIVAFIYREFDDDRYVPFIDVSTRINNIYPNVSYNYSASDFTYWVGTVYRFDLWVLEG